MTSRFDEHHAGGNSPAMITLIPTAGGEDLGAEFRRARRDWYRKHGRRAPDWVLEPLQREARRLAAERAARAAELTAAVAAWPVEPPTPPPAPEPAMPPEAPPVVERPKRPRRWGWRPPPLRSGPLALLSQKTGLTIDEVHALLARGMTPRQVTEHAAERHAAGWR
ncbi:MAG: hypothetical protein HOW73_43495 [Polyangiaceae bacterium]|nr:hypothetical protein [Polyangiaceae bacterium]